MQTKCGLAILLAVVCVSTLGCAGSTGRGVDRFYGIINSPAADATLVSIDVRRGERRHDHTDWGDRHLWLHVGRALEGWDLVQRVRPEQLR